MSSCIIKNIFMCFLKLSLIWCFLHWQFSPIQLVCNLEKRVLSDLTHLLLNILLLALVIKYWILNPRKFYIYVFAFCTFTSEFCEQEAIAVLSHGHCACCLVPLPYLPSGSHTVNEPWKQHPTTMRKHTDPQAVPLLNGFHFALTYGSTVLHTTLNMPASLILSHQTISYTSLPILCHTSFMQLSKEKGSILLGL